MRQIGLWSASAIALSGALAGCSGDGSEPRRIIEWQGSAAHFETAGFLDGESLDLSIGADASDTSKLYCTREWIAPEVAGMPGVPDYPNGELTEIKINAEFGPRLVELELKRHDTQSDPAGTVVTVVPRVDGTTPASTEIWVEWEWHNTSDDATIYEAAAQSGTFTLGEFTGDTDSTGLVIPEGVGQVGGYITARWSETEFLDISFTAICTKGKVETIGS